jgi:hypothetical protein
VGSNPGESALKNICQGNHYSPDVGHQAYDWDTTDGEKGAVQFFFFTGRLLLRAFDRLDRQLAGVEDRAIVALASQVKKLAALDGNLPGNEYIILLRNCVQSRECLKIKI